MNSVLIGLPTSVGSPQGSDSDARALTQMSRPPFPLGRVDAIKKSFPSRDGAGHPSRNAVLKLRLAPGGASSIDIARLHVDENDILLASDDMESELCELVGVSGAHPTIPDTSTAILQARNTFMSVSKRG